MKFDIKVDHFNIFDKVRITALTSLLKSSKFWGFHIEYGKRDILPLTGFSEKGVA